MRPNKINEQPSLANLNELFFAIGDEILRNAIANKYYGSKTFLTGKIEAHLACAFAALIEMKVKNLHFRELYIISEKIVKDYYDNYAPDIYMYPDGKNESRKGLCIIFKKMGSLKYSDFITQIFNSLGYAYYKMASSIDESAMIFFLPQKEAKQFLQDFTVNPKASLKIVPNQYNKLEPENWYDAFCNAARKKGDAINTFDFANDSSNSKKPPQEPIVNTISEGQTSAENKVRVEGPAESETTKSTKNPQESTENYSNTISRKYKSPRQTISAQVNTTTADPIRSFTNAFILIYSAILAGEGGWKNLFLFQFLKEPDFLEDKILFSSAALHSEIESSLMPRVKQAQDISQKYVNNCTIKNTGLFLEIYKCALRNAGGIGRFSEKASISMREIQQAANEDPSSRTGKIVAVFSKKP